MDESTRRRMTNATTTKPGRFEEEWVKLDLAPTMMRCKENLQKAALIIMNVRPELAINGKLLTRTALALFACEEVVIRYGEREDRPAGELVMPKLSVEAMSYEEGPSGSGKSAQRHDEEQEDRQPEKPVEQNPDQAGKDGDKASVGGASRVDFNFLDEENRKSAIDSFAFERGPAMIAKTHAHLVEEMNLAESEVNKSAEFVDRSQVCRRNKNVGRDD